jgi:hypothetical protein
MQAPAAPQAPVIAGLPGVNSPTAVWRAFQAQRDELSSQLDHLNDLRRDISEQLHSDQPPASKASLEARITGIDKQIQSVEQQLGEANTNVARAAAVPGAVVKPPPFERQGPPDEAWVLGGLFIVVVLFPLSFALARRIWRRGAAAVAAIPQDITDRLTRLDQAVDSIAVEVERIGEGQRFVTRVLTERELVLGAGPARPVDASAREGARVGERKG